MTGNWQKESCLTRLGGRPTENRAGKEEKWGGRSLYPWEETQKKRESLGGAPPWGVSESSHSLGTLVLGSDTVKGRTLLSGAPAPSYPGSHPAKAQPLQPIGFTVGGPVDQWPCTDNSGRGSSCQEGEEHTLKGAGLT